MKQTRMQRHEEKIRATIKRNKKIITFTTLVGLICPATLGTIQALADETATQQTELQPQTANTATEATNETAIQDQPTTETASQTPATPEPSPIQNELNQPEQTTPTETAQETQVTENTVVAETTASNEQTEEQASATEESAKIEVQSFEAEEASFSSYLNQIKPILDGVESKIITDPHRVKHDDLITRWHIASSAGNDTPANSRDQAFYDQWLAELQNILNEANQLKTDVDASQTAEIYTYYVVRNVVDDNGNIVDSTRYPETAVKDSTIEISAINWYGYYLVPGTPNKYSAQITQNDTQEFVFTYMSVTSQKHRDPAKEKQISDLFTELGDLHWELKLKSDGTQYAEPLQELWYRMDIVSASVGMFMQSHGYIAWYEYALSNLPTILADMKALAVEINAIQPEESFTAGELDLINARKVLSQRDSLDPYDYTEESWNKMNELDSQGEIYGASGALRTLCDYPDSQIIKGSKDKIQQNVYEWTNRLTEAMKVLVKVGNGETPLQQSIAKLRRTITNAESKIEEASIYTAESIKALRSALQTAKDVLANPNSTKIEIDAALSSLNTAMTNLKKADGNSGETPLQQSIAKLRRTITNAESKIEEASVYTAESIKALRSALQTAKDVLANPNSTKIEIDTALSSLNTAMTNLKKADGNSGETPLQQSIAKLRLTITNAESKIEEASIYTAESIKALRSALQTAKDVLANPNSTKVEIDTALSSLNTAMTNLKKTDGNGINGNNGSNNNTGNNSSNKTNTTNVSNKIYLASKNNSRKGNLPQTGDATTNGLLAGLSMIGLSAIAWIKRKRKA